MNYFNSKSLHTTSFINNENLLQKETKFILINDILELSFEDCFHFIQ